MSVGVGVGVGVGVAGVTCVAAMRNLINHHAAFDIETILAFDAARRVNIAAERVLDGPGGGLAGWLGGVDRERPALPAIMTMMREISRRDIGLGLAYCTTSFIAATNVWLAASDAQREQFRLVLARGERVAVAYHEPEHGNDLAANECRATQVGDTWRIDGAKDIINNIDRAGCVVLHARTGNGQPQRRHSLFLVGRDQLVDGAVSLTPRRATHGARNCRIGGARFDGLVLPESCLLGEVGRGFEYALRAFQLSRAALPGASLGSVETAFKLAVGFALGRQLYGGDLLMLPVVRRSLASVAMRLWAADSLSQAVTACAHLAPAHLSLYSAVAKFWIPRSMRAALRDLGSILGAHGYLRQGDHALFEKILRDYPVVSVGHAGGLLCQAAVLAVLPRALNGRSGFEAYDGFSTRLFDVSPLPPLDMQALRLVAPGGDPLLDSLAALAGTPRGAVPAVADAAQSLAAHRSALAASFDPTRGEDAERYARLLAAASVLHRMASGVKLRPIHALLSRALLDTLIHDDDRRPAMSFADPIMSKLSEDFRSGIDLLTTTEGS